MTEVPPEQVTRNWNELLQELRVVQTGAQILTGFLLTVPFSARFAELSPGQERFYLAILAGATVTTGLLLAPVAFHRVLFRRHERLWIVETANTTAKAGLAMLALTTAGVVGFVFDVVAGRTASLVGGAASLLFVTTLWVVLPHAAHGHQDQDDPRRTRSE